MGYWPPTQTRPHLGNRQKASFLRKSASVSRPPLRLCVRIGRTRRTKSARTTPTGGGCADSVHQKCTDHTCGGGLCLVHHKCTFMRHIYGGGLCRVHQKCTDHTHGGGCVCCTKSAPLTLTSTGGGCATGFSETRLHQKCTRKILHLRGGAVPTGCTKSARTTPTGGGCSWCTKSARSDAHISGGGL